MVILLFKYFIILWGVERFINSFILRKKVMRTVNEIFTDKEFKCLKKKKGERTWREFILEIADCKKEE